MQAIDERTAKYITLHIRALSTSDAASLSNVEIKLTAWFFFICRKVVVNARLASYMWFLPFFSWVLLLCPFLLSFGFVFL